MLTKSSCALRGHQTSPAFFHQLAAALDGNGLSYLGTDALKELMQTVVACEMRCLQGIIVETGCALGGSAIGIAAAKSRERELRCYDVFSMIPSPSEEDGADVHARYAEIVSGKSVGLKGNVYYGYQENLLSVVETNFLRYGFPIGEHAVHLVKGPYQDTLYIDTPVILAHIDCDWYDSVKLCFERIAPHMAEGGVMIIDDYRHYSGCRQAVEEFMAQNETFERIDGKSRLHLRKR
jgi:asparagine synthase (glutamine-hydrolysing)